MTKHIFQKYTLAAFVTLLSVTASQFVPANAATLSGEQVASTINLSTEESNTATDISPVTSLIVAISSSGATSSSSYASSATTGTDSQQTTSAWEITASQTTDSQTTAGTSTTAVPEPAEIGGGIFSLVFLWLIQRRLTNRRSQVELKQPEVEITTTKA